jgi:hypothetical protein
MTAVPPAARPFIDGVFDFEYGANGYFKPPGSSGVARVMDVHGAGAQRSDSKAGDPANFPSGRGPQGDVVRILNYVRLARDTGENITPLLGLYFSSHPVKRSRDEGPVC